MRQNSWFVIVKLAAPLRDLLFSSLRLCHEVWEWPDGSARVGKGPASWYFIQYLLM